MQTAEIIDANLYVAIVSARWAGFCRWMASLPNQGERHQTDWLARAEDERQGELAALGRWAANSAMLDQGD